MHSSLQSLTALSLRAILYLQDYFWSITLQSWGAKFLYILFSLTCVGFIIFSHLFNRKTHTTHEDIVYVLQYFMTEFVFSQLKWRIWRSLYSKVLNIYRAYMTHIIIKRTSQVGYKLFFPSITLTAQEFLLKMDTNYMDNLRLFLIKWTVNVLIYVTF